MNKPIISILLPAYKSKDLLSKVFLKSHINPDTTELIIYDNGGNDFTPEFKEDINAYGKNNPDFWKCVRMDDTSLKCHTVIVGDGQNIGLNAALNECAKVATGDYFYLCHTDMFLLNGWDTSLIEVHKNIPTGQILLCSRSIEKSSHTPFHVLKDFGQTPEDFKEKELLEFFKTYKDKGIVLGYRMPFFLHRKLWDKMGGVDPQFFSYATDNDLFFTAYDVGIRRFYLVQNSVVYHLSGRSNSQQNVDRDDFEPYRKLILKWKKYGVDANIDASEQRLVPWNVKVR